MNTTLWIIAGFLATGFLIASSTKLFISAGKTGPGAWWWMGPGLQRRFAQGPRSSRDPGCRRPDPARPCSTSRLVLVPLAATGLATIMVGAAVVNYRRQEFKHVLVNLTYLALLALVAFGRFGPWSFTG